MLQSPNEKVFSRLPLSSGQNELRDKVNRTLVHISHSFELDYLHCCPYGFCIFEKFCKLENEVDFLRRYNIIRFCSGIGIG